MGGLAFVRGSPQIPAPHRETLTAACVALECVPTAPPASPRGRALARLVVASAVALAVTVALLALALASGNRGPAAGAAGIAALAVAAVVAFSVASSRATRDEPLRDASLVALAFGRAGSPRRRTLASMSLATAAALVVVYALAALSVVTQRVGFAILAAVVAFGAAASIARRFPGPVLLGGNPTVAVGVRHVVACRACERLNEREAERCVSCGASLDRARLEALTARAGT